MRTEGLNHRFRGKMKIKACWKCPFAGHSIGIYTALCDHLDAGRLEIDFREEFSIPEACPLSRVPHDLKTVSKKPQKKLRRFVSTATLKIENARLKAENVRLVAANVQLKKRIALDKSAISHLTFTPK